ncbi:MAG: biotin transporter BioY [Deferribacteraceae bacterium]|jgi:biotin transport system substrate-specific component|nr:biotin transporter BioY [Deferribacteraceae bacterium]
MNSQKIAITGVLTSLFAVSAFIRIPTPFVPLTMQTFVVLLAPMLVGAKYSFAAVALYIALGLAGLPIFANGGGPAYIFQPTFGFLIGFLLSTIPCGLLSRNKNGFLPLFLSGMIASVIIHLAGGIGFWLSMNLAQGKDVSLYKAATLAVVPFIVPNFIKLTAAVFIARRLKPALRDLSSVQNAKTVL